MIDLLEFTVLDNIRVFGKESKNKFHHVWEFRKNYQEMNSYDFKQTHQAIRDILDGLNVNYAILMYAHGTFVFTEVPVNLNPVIVKLASGINFSGEIVGVDGVLNQVNGYLGRQP